MQKSRPIVIAILVLVSMMLVSGCVGQSSSSTPATIGPLPNDGLAIASFFAEPTSVDVGDAVTFTLQVENVGGVTAANVAAYLQGVEGQWRELTSGNPLVHYSIKQVRTLLPSNPTFNQAGDTDMVTWMYKTPTIAPGLQNFPADVTATVLYDYNTTGAMVIKAVGDSFLRTEYIAKSRTPVGPSITNTNAPVKILIPDTVSSYYIRVKDSASDAAFQYFPVQFKLVNVGSGYPLTNGIPGAIYGTISLRGPGNPVFSECLGQTNVADIVIGTDSAGADLARLKTSQGAVTVSCIMRLAKNSFVLQDEQIRLDFNLGYRYYIQRSLQVSISSLQ